MLATAVAFLSFSPSAALVWVGVPVLITFTVITQALAFVLLLPLLRR